LNSQTFRIGLRNGRQKIILHCRRPGSRSFHKSKIELQSNNILHSTIHWKAIIYSFFSFDIQVLIFTPFHSTLLLPCVPLYDFLSLTQILHSFHFLISIFLF
jgi:hypothetical protein